MSARLIDAVQVAYWLTFIWKNCQLSNRSNLIISISMWDKEGENQCQGNLKMLILALKLKDGFISQLFKEIIKAGKYKRKLFHCQP